MIITFASKDTEAIFNGYTVRHLPPTIQSTARRKLKVIAAAVRLDDLRAPPGNHLEKLDRDRAGQWSIRINRQWRICFNWRDDNAWDVEITDYH